MMSYDVHTPDRVIRDLAKLDAAVARRISKSIDRLGDHAEDVKHEALTGQFAGFCRLRVGDYRVIYKIIHEKRAVVIHIVGLRREIYDQ